jgi:predicted kinase
VPDDRRASLDRPPADLDWASSQDGPERAALNRKLASLPDGHPSSPNEADGSPRQPMATLRDLEPDVGDDRTEPTDRARPFTDAEWADHVADVRTLLDKADAEGLATELQYTTDPDRQKWTPARDRIQGNLVTDIYDRSSHVPSDRMAIIAGGLGGAGKSTVLSRFAGIDLSQYLIINPDNVKEEMAKRGLIPEVEGLSTMEASDLVHEESSAVAKQLAHKALADGKNIVWDITMSSRATTERRISDLRAAGYMVDGLFVDIPVETSVRRADSRHREGEDDYRAGKGLGGRYVPAEVIRTQGDPVWGSKNRETFENVNHLFDHWDRYDNSVDGRLPQLVDTGGPYNGNREGQD